MPWRSRGGVEVWLYSFIDLVARWGWVVNAMPQLLYPPGNTQYPLYRGLGGPQGRSEQVWKISPPLGFDPWTVQPVASRYADSYPGPPSAKEYSLMGHVWLPLACSHSNSLNLCDMEVGKTFIVNSFIWKWTPDGSDDGTWSVFSDQKTHIILEAGSASASW
jgi:hypothetical protein